MSQGVVGGPHRAASMPQAIRFGQLGSKRIMRPLHTCCDSRWDVDLQPLGQRDEGGQVDREELCEEGLVGEQGGWQGRGR